MSSTRRARSSRRGSSSSIGHGAEKVREAVAAPDVQFAVQEQQLGTGHAVQQALPLLDPSVPTLVLYGDVPLTRASTLQATVDARGSRALRRAHRDARRSDAATAASCAMRSGKVQRIVEQKDASADERQIAEINTGIIITPTRAARRRGSRR